MLSFEPFPFALAKNWLNRLYSSLKKIDSEREAELNRIANIFCDPEDLAEYYIEPDCQQFNPADSDDEAESYLIREPIFDRIAAFLSGDKKKTCKHLFILSDAGMGKTSLLVMLKLAHLTSFWPKNYECHLLKLDRDTINSLAKIVNRKNTVLLLDGLDEDPLAWENRNSRIREILTETDNFKRVIITCRNQFMSRALDPFHRRGCIEIEGFICPVVYNSLFSDRQVTNYLKRRFPKMIGKQEWEQRVTKIILSMGHLKMRPMLLAHIDDLLESTETDWNESTIYGVLVRAWLMREQRKIRLVQGSAPPLAELHDACRYIALTIHGKDRLYLTAQEMAVHALVFSGVSQISVMQLGVRSLLNRDSTGNYKFSHFSILEYLVVDCLVNDVMRGLTTNIRPTALMVNFASAWIINGNYTSKNIAKLRQIGLRNADFSGCDLSGIDLSGFDCTDSNFSGANLAGAKFERSILKRSCFRNAVLCDGSFQNAQLIDADLASSDASNTSFKNADLTSASFESAILYGANLDASQFKNLNTMSAKIDARTILPIK